MYSETTGKIVACNNLKEEKICMYQNEFVAVAKMSRWSVTSINWLPLAAYDKIYEQRNKVAGTV